MPDVQDSTESADRLLHHLAASGRLSSAIKESRVEQARWLRRAAYEIAVPLVWSHHTRPLEQRKGHWVCAQRLKSLNPDCADGFVADLDAVVTALFSYRPPIANIEGWMVRRMANAIKDGQRRRRAELGAQQRVRVPAWLATRLSGDAWLIELARLVLEWVGVPSSAGPSRWPLDNWAARRARFTGQWAVDLSPADVERDLRHVLAEMRAGRPAWFERYVETPLHLKPPMMVPLPVTAGPPAEDDHRRDAHLLDLASTALAAIGGLLAGGSDPLQAVTSVIGAVFLGASGVCADLDRPPGEDHCADRLEWLFTDPQWNAEFVAQVMCILAADQGLRNMTAA